MWFSADAVGAVLEGCVTLMAGGVVMAGVLAVATADGSAVWDVTAASFSYVPAVATVGALGLTGWALSAHGVGVGWAVVAWASVVGLLGTTLRLPEWAVNVSPLTHVGRPPLDAVAWESLAILAVLAAGLTMWALRWFAVRDLRAG
jgi:ABC-2 type transport system permease protein